MLYHKNVIFKKQFLIFLQTIRQAIAITQCLFLQNNITALHSEPEKKYPQKMTAFMDACTDVISAVNTFLLKTKYAGEKTIRKKGEVTQECGMHR